MKALSFYLLYSLLWLITLLPLQILYALSAFLHLLVFHVAGYRKNTVTRNLKRSFPEKDEKEIKRIRRGFYRQLMDYFLEWMYGIHMGKREITRRMKIRNPGILKDYYSQGKSIMLLMSHHGNWEWMSVLPLHTEHAVLAIYKPLHNKYFDKLFLDLRQKFGIVGVPMKSTMRSLVEHERAGQPVIIYTLADQRPRTESIQHWARFLNQDTPVVAGPEKIARRFNMVTMFLEIHKVKKGRYEAEFKVLSESPGEQKEYEIIRAYLGALEGLIRSYPEQYLWTHDRWKHKRERINKPAVDI